MTVSSISNAVLDWLKEIKNTDFVNMDGTDVSEKMADLARCGGYVGFNWALIHSIFFHPPSLGMAAVSVVNKTALFAIMGATFAGTTSIISQATGKERKINYFAGGCLAGTLLGVRSKNMIVGSQACAAAGGLAVLRKWYDENGWEFR